MTVKQSNEQRYYDALKKIAEGYASSRQIINKPEKYCGLDDSQEGLEYCYDNIQWEAAQAIKGRRRPKV